MRVPKIYIETSIFNFVFADDAPEKTQDTLKLFDEIAQGKYEPYTASYVLEELIKTKEPKKSKMIDLIEQYGVTVLRASEEAEKLADVYVENGIIPVKYILDAVHIAMTTVCDLDFIVSFNFKHIKKRKPIEMTELINYQQGYKRIGIFSPTEVIEDDE
jgi:predicted nucleic acid-binding protein